jgi:hypothetical protein
MVEQLAAIPVADYIASLSFFTIIVALIFEKMILVRETGMVAQ